jgi:hypothetical protein
VIQSFPDWKRCLIFRNEDLGTDFEVGEVLTFDKGEFRCGSYFAIAKKASLPHLGFMMQVNFNLIDFAA